MKISIIAILSLFIVGCAATKGPMPSYYAYGNAPKLLEKNVTTYEQVKELYGESNTVEQIEGGIRCTWQNLNTVVRSTEQFGAQASLTNFDPGRSIGRYTYTVVYSSKLVAVFSNDHILRSFTISNKTE